MLTLPLSETNHNSTIKSRVCLNCGAELTGRSNKKYCNRTCFDEYVVVKKEKRLQRVCRYCGVEFIMTKPSGKHNKGIVKEGQFCSRKCYGKWRTKNKKNIYPSVKVYFPACDVCGKVFTSKKSNSKTCSVECKNKKSNNRYYANRERLCKEAREKYKEQWEPPNPFRCVVCGEMCQSEYGETKTVYCSDTCSKAGRRYKPKWRARENGVYYEPIDPLKVFKRDGWRCQLCGKKLKKKNRGTMRDDAPELDHIITWAEGGEHSYKNTQCSCRKCNREKSSQSKGQLLLFGK